MKLFVTIVICLIAFAPVSPAKDEFVPLFNGKDLSGWTATLRPPKEAPDTKPDPAKTLSVKYPRLAPGKYEVWSGDMKVDVEVKANETAKIELKKK